MAVNGLESERVALLMKMDSYGGKETMNGKRFGDINTRNKLLVMLWT